MGKIQAMMFHKVRCCKICKAAIKITRHLSEHTQLT